MSLDERTTLANTKRGDLFISLHANASAPTKCGIETFWFEPRFSSDIAAPGIVQTSALQKAFYSKKLAESVHTHLLESVQQQYPEAINRRVKKGGLQVLIGTHMPSILIEMGFLSHQQEALLLKDSKYQNLLVQGIIKGIEEYREIVPATYANYFHTSDNMLP